MMMENVSVRTLKQHADHHYLLCFCAFYYFSSAFEHFEKFDFVCGGCHQDPAIELSIDGLVSCQGIDRKLAISRPSRAGSHCLSLVSGPATRLEDFDPETT